MITITSLSSIGGAMALKAYLEERKIPAFIPDDYMAMNDWDGPTPASAPLNSIRVQVPASYERQAAKAAAAFFRYSGV